MPFHYQPLPKGSKAIRVLELCPGRKKDKIECSLQYHSFPPADSAAYEPLSYCWGDMRDKVSITVNGCGAEVTRNLHAALVQLRLKNERRRLWVDAVCINQNDDTEKSDQVNMMREIYQHGSQTLVWLGPDSLVLTRGFSVITRMLKGLKFYEEKNGLETSQHVDRLPSVHTYNRPPLLAIFELPYFTRIWVIQEVAVSSSVTVFCGHNSISWDDLVAAEKWSNTVGAEVYDDMRSLTLFRNISAARSKYQTGIKQNLLQLLTAHRGTAATCTKDKIYALLGLLDPGDLQNSCIVPNYRKKYTTEEAYIDIAVSIIITSENLDVLSVPGTLTSDSTNLQLPTWVPDWSRPSSSYTLIWSSEGPSFAATGSSTSRPIFRDNRTAVGILGYVFDEVDCIGCANADIPIPATRKAGANIYSHQFFSNLQSLRFKAEQFRAWKSWLRVTCARSREAYVTNEPMLEVYSKTFVSRCAVLNADEWVEERKQWEAVIGGSIGPSGFLDRSTVWIAYWLASMAFEKLRDTVLGIPKPMLSDEPFVRTYGRSMFTTKGTYIGLGPKDLQTGDCLALLEGGKVPYVLRRNGQTFNFVGECYVHGIMFGERFDATRCEQIWLV